MSPNVDDGFLFIDKPAGISSFQVVKRVRWLSSIKRVGHAGTLDPFATGLLIVAMGRSHTKLIDQYQSMPKVYDAELVLVIQTTTLDPEGEQTTLDASVLTWSKRDILDKFNAILPQFLGDISQIPPHFSAKKVQGQRLYRLARKGILPELKPSKIHIFSLEILDVILGENGMYPRVRFRTHCSKGTYVRQLALDLAIAVGSVAHLSSLRRVMIGPYSVDTAVAYDTLTPEYFSHA
jgi:tRNA pseudouridine55 synthase